jgi:hypothetical protein
MDRRSNRPAPFDLAQAGLHLHRQRDHRIVLLHLARQAFCHCAGSGVSPDTSASKRADGIGVRREIIRQMTDVLQAVFRKQQGGRHFQRQLFAAACGYGFARHSASWRSKAPSADRFSCRTRRHVMQRSVKAASSAGSISALAAVPVRLGLRDAGLARSSASVSTGRSARFVIGWRQAVQRKSGAHCCTMATRIRAGGGDKEQGITQHASGCAASPWLSGGSAIDQAKQLLHIQAASQPAGHQFGEGLHGEPEGARLSVLLRIGHQLDGVQQRARIAGAFQVGSSARSKKAGVGRSRARPHRRPSAAAG